MSERPSAPPHAAAPASAADEGSDYSRREQTQFIIIAFLVIMVAFVDRQIIALLAEPIRTDLGLTDFQISLLGGLAFSLFYAICGIPIGRLLDGGNRVKIVALGLLGWSVATLATGFTTSFLVIFFLRTIVAVGEATASPGCISMATDIFRTERLGRTIALIMFGGVAGQGVALIGGGALLDVLGDHVSIAGWSLASWQVVFILAALPGIVLAPIAVLAIRHPQRRFVSRDTDGQARRATMAEFWLFLRLNRATVIGHALGYSIYSMAEKALIFWAPTYLVRTFQFSPGEAGYKFGFIVVVTTIVGNYISGWFVDRWNAAGRHDAALRVGCLTALITVIPLLAIPFASTGFLGLLALGLSLFTMSGYTTVTVAQALVAPNQVRSQYVGFYLLISHLVGGVIGTSLVALLNEYIFVGREDIGSSLTLVCVVGCALSAGLLGLTLRPYRRSIDQTREGVVHAG